MNVVTANENKQIIDRLEIDIIKRIDGAFELNDLLGKFVNLYFNKMIIDITSINNYQDINVIHSLAKAVDPSRVILLLNNDPIVNSQLYRSELVKDGFYNVTSNYEGITYLYNNPNTYESVKHLVLTDNQTHLEEEKARQEQAMREAQTYRDPHARLIIGLANLTAHGGSSSLLNMMVRQLKAHGIKAYGIEMFRNDLLFYHTPDDLFSCMNRNDLDREIKKREDAQAFIMDINDFGEAERYCDIILYLIEPSYIGLTKMIKKDRNVLATHKDDNIVLNKSFVTGEEITDFEKETGLKVFYNLPPLNDRNQNNEEVNDLLRKLGFMI